MESENFNDSRKRMHFARLVSSGLNQFFFVRKLSCIKFSKKVVNKVMPCVVSVHHRKVTLLRTKQLRYLCCIRMQWSVASSENSWRYDIGTAIRWIDRFYKLTDKEQRSKSADPKNKLLKMYTTGAIRCCLQDTDIKLCIVFRSRPKVLPNEAVASSSGHTTYKLCSWNNKFRSWNWKYFFRISDRDQDHVQNLTDSSQCHYLSSIQISWKSVH